MSDRTVVALTIAGSDSGGGAGIQADLKTFSALGVFGKTVITSITSQNTLGVQAVDDLPVGVVESQLKSILEDNKCQAVKTGMLGNEQIADRVASLLKRYRIKKLVIDPVIFSTSGKKLLTPSGVETMKKRLLPLAHLVTPNIKEAEILSGIRIRRSADRKPAALSKEAILNRRRRHIFSSTSVYLIFMTARFSGSWRMTVKIILAT